MCQMCYRPMFPTIDFGHTEKAKWFAKATLLKNEIKAHEQVIQEALEKGESPCENTVKRLTSYKREQYALSHEI